MNEASPSRLREMLVAIPLDKRKKRSERIAVFHRLNEKFNDWVNTHKETVFEWRRKKDWTPATIDVIQLGDGQWMESHDLMLADRGMSSGINPHNDVYESRDEAVRQGAITLLIYLLQQTVRSDMNATTTKEAHSAIRALLPVALPFMKKQEHQFSLF